LSSANTTVSRPIFNRSAISKIAGLVGPVGGEAGDILAPQHHFRVLLERLERIRLVVLGAYRENDAAPRQVARIALEGDKGLPESAALPERDPGQTVVADDAAP
jgi:hypothetical protein